MKILAACLLLAALSAGAIGARPSAAGPKPIVTVVVHGGLCFAGGECRKVFRISDTRITAPGFVPRRLTTNERAALLRAIGSLRLAYLRAHPFTGMCPTAHDSTESIYRFRGFARVVPSCTYDVRGVKAVILTDGLLAQLKPR